MKTQQLKILSQKELVDKKLTLMREKLELLILKRNQQLQKTHRLRIIRREIAQLNTFMGTNQS